MSSQEVEDPAEVWLRFVYNGYKTPTDRSLTEIHAMQLDQVLCFLLHLLSWAPHSLENHG
jgi:hypothetical protein